MPVSPELAADAAKATLDLYLDAERRMLELLAGRLEAGIDAPDWADRKLAETQLLRASIEAEIRRLQDDMPDVVEDGIRRAHNRGVATAGTDLKAAGTSVDIAFGRVNLDTVQSLVDATVSRVGGTHLRILRSTLDAYRDTVARTAGAVATGTATRRQAAQETLDGFARRGITGFVDTAGRSWELASYAEMAVRTTAGQAAVDGHLGRLLEAGHDLVIVSDAPQECPTCRPWEGRILSISGQSRGKVRGDNLRGSGTVAVDVAGTMAEARAAGLFHPNCRHSTGLYVPGVTRPLRGTADPAGDEARQELRRLERGVREWKRRSAAAIDPDAKTKADGKVREWQARIREHAEATPAKRQRAREQIGAAR